MGVLPNIKPWLLADSHPQYESATQSGVCIRDPDHPDRPYVGLFWSGGAGACALTSRNALVCLVVSSLACRVACGLASHAHN